MIRIFVATRNRHKVEEIRAILGRGYRVASLEDLTGAPALIEDAEDFVGNATRKACQLAEYLTRVPDSTGPWDGRSTVCVLADDSGLEVDALGGAPGVHSARFAQLSGAGQANASDNANNRKLLDLLRDVPSERRTARFRCALALISLEAEGGRGSRGVVVPKPEIFEGVCEGRIGLEERGAGGFGYDPLFYAMGYSASFAELGEEVKNRLSHRFKALRNLKVWLETKG